MEQGCGTPKQELVIEPVGTECEQSLSRHPGKNLQSVSQDEGRRGGGRGFSTGS